LRWINRRKKTLKLWMRVDDGVEVISAADHHFASNDRLDSVIRKTVARQDPFARKTQGDDLSPA